ncbi:helix-turn-helix domain-containing protein [Rhodococcus wratislaviensis]|uniref:winged helix-turn-helix domain-containing protein n=1 Tax=Rhodococcus wratislaviensis TaxID=44752 RepID=UPI003512F3BC
MPLQQPEFPWAIYLASSDHRFRLLAFDFDTSRFGADQARSDADRLAAHLDDLGVYYLRAHSGPAGGQHIWLRLGADGADPTAVRELARVLGQHYPTFDRSPLGNPDKGVVRPPGAPHRHGGRSIPHLAGAKLQQALERVSRGTAPDVVDWLLARHPHVEPATPLDEQRRRPQRIIEDAAGPRLDRPRRPLPHRTAALLATVPSKGADRSALAYTILLSMAHAGHTLDDARAAVATAPGLIRLREDAARGRDDTERQWGRALARAATFTANPGQAPREPIDGELDEIEHALAATTAHWGRRGGASDERILHALTAFARTARTRVVDIDCRRLAQACGIDASTVSRRLRVLAAEGWVTLATPGTGSRAATWILNRPVDAEDFRATQGEPAPASGMGLTLLAHHTHDVWSYRRCGGLGAAAARVHWFYRLGAETPEALAEMTGYGLAFTVHILRQLAAAGLLNTMVKGKQLLCAFEHAAKALGVSGINARRIARHLADRELFAWWNEEQQWRTTPGKKRGTRRPQLASILTLPISAPARVRYGRFPTKQNGKADYTTARKIVALACDRPTCVAA